MNGSSPPFTPAAAATAAASFQEQQQYFEQQQQQQYFDQHGMAWGYESPHFQQPMQPYSPATCYGVAPPHFPQQPSPVAAPQLHSPQQMQTMMQELSDARIAAVRYEAERDAARAERERIRLEAQLEIANLKLEAAAAATTAKQSQPTHPQQPATLQTLPGSTTTLPTALPGLLPIPPAPAAPHATHSTGNALPHAIDPLASLAQSGSISLPCLLSQNGANGPTSTLSTTQTGSIPSLKTASNLRCKLTPSEVAFY